MRVIAIVLVIAVLGVTLFWLKTDGYTPYVPVRLNAEQELVYDAAMLDAELADSIPPVLDQYGESYQIRDGQVYVTKRLLNDMDTLWNYTSKAVAERERAVQ